MVHVMCDDIQLTCCNFASYMFPAKAGKFSFVRCLFAVHLFGSLFNEGNGFKIQRCVQNIPLFYYRIQGFQLNVG